ncbi:hypothetical protein I302_106482 [Kwoniella bestiolae CBS 10118]|uniref:Uncharacterized protein n=1 Tax=Kwoniella bestiolae CBS 10118 TaxID=1296100 RepID=A0A1B9G1B1_9TREE|nr:hypothetical protein I302_06261 [Kwoniella bestiolae CBS 10118]OCF24800.1 hypothetical protein I302_06261 [Kwoniella bestiolae CBS 10118]
MAEQYTIMPTVSANSDSGTVESTNNADAYAAMGVKPEAMWLTDPSICEVIEHIAGPGEFGFRLKHDTDFGVAGESRTITLRAGNMCDWATGYRFKSTVFGGEKFHAHRLSPKGHFLEGSNDQGSHAA